MIFYKLFTGVFYDSGQRLDCILAIKKLLFQLNFRRLDNKNWIVIAGPVIAPQIKYINLKLRESRWRCTLNQGNFLLVCLFIECCLRHRRKIQSKSIKKYLLLLMSEGQKWLCRALALQPFLKPSSYPAWKLIILRFMIFYSVELFSRYQIYITTSADVRHMNYTYNSYSYSV